METTSKKKYYSLPSSLRKTLEGLPGIVIDKNKSDEFSVSINPEKLPISNDIKSDEITLFQDCLEKMADPDPNIDPEEKKIIALKLQQYITGLQRFNKPRKWFHSTLAILAILAIALTITFLGPVGLVALIPLTVILSPIAFLLLVSIVYFFGIELPEDLRKKLDIVLKTKRYVLDNSLKGILKHLPSVYFDDTVDSNFCIIIDEECISKHWDIVLVKKALEKLANPDISLEHKQLIAKKLQQYLNLHPVIRYFVIGTAATLVLCATAMCTIAACEVIAGLIMATALVGIYVVPAIMIGVWGVAILGIIGLAIGVLHRHVSKPGIALANLLEKSTYEDNNACKPESTNDSAELNSQLDPQSTPSLNAKSPSKGLTFFPKHTEITENTAANSLQSEQPQPQTVYKR